MLQKSVCALKRFFPKESCRELLLYDLVSTVVTCARVHRPKKWHGAQKSDDRQVVRYYWREHDGTRGISEEPPSELTLLELLTRLHTHRAALIKKRSERVVLTEQTADKEDKRKCTRHTASFLTYLRSEAFT